MVSGTRPRSAGDPRRRLLLLPGTAGQLPLGTPSAAIVAAAHERGIIATTKDQILRSDTTTLDDGCELEVQAFLYYVQNTPYVRDAFEQFRAAQAARPS